MVARCVRVCSGCLGLLGRSKMRQGSSPHHPGSQMNLEKYPTSASFGSAPASSSRAMTAHALAAVARISRTPAPRSRASCSPSSAAIMGVSSSLLATFTAAPPLPTSSST